MGGSEKSEFWGFFPPFVSFPRSVRGTSSNRREEPVARIEEKLVHPAFCFVFSGHERTFKLRARLRRRL